MAFGRGLQSVFRQPIQLRPVPLAEEVQTRFLNARGASSTDTLRPAYHGTDIANFKSIAQRGLLIPRSSNGLRVVNGSANGLGVYTAEVNNASLSWSYSRSVSKLMFVCAVLDPGDASQVLHAGGAMIAFDIARVAPLFYATTATHIDAKPPSNAINNGRAKREILSQRFPEKARKVEWNKRGKAFQQVRNEQTGLVGHYARRAAQKRRA